MRNEKTKLVPKLRFPEFREAEAWNKFKLGSAAFFYNGRAYKQEELLERGRYKVLRVGNFFTNNWYYSDLELEDEKYCDEGDLLYAWSASFGPRVWKEGKTIYHYHIWKVVQREGVDKAFLFITLEHQTERMKAESANGLGLLHITKGTIESWEACFPKVPEQQKIAECLSSVDELMAAQVLKVEALKTHKKGLMQQLFPREGETQPRLRFPEFQNAGEWAEVALGDIAEIKLGKMLDKQKHTAGHLLPYLNNLAVRWNGVSTSDLPKMYFNDRERDRFGLRAGDVVVCEGGEPGRAAVWDGRLPDLKFQKAIHRVRFNVPFEPKILVLHLENLAGTTEFEMLFTGGGIKHLTGETFSRLKIPLIPHAEQQRIASCLSSLDALITAETQKLEALKTHKKGLMQQLFASPEEVES